MKNFAKSILNYYAAFNETRFRFTSRSAQKWTNNELSLDFSVFPEFINEVLSKLSIGKKLSLSIKPDQYSLYLDETEYDNKLRALLEKTLTTDFIEEVKSEQFANLPEDTQFDLYELYRKWGLVFRKNISDLLLQLQEEKKSELIAHLDTEYLPLSTLNTATIEYELFEIVKKIAQQNHNIEDFISETRAAIQKYKPNLKMYDLYSLLQSIHRLSSTNTTQLYLHQLTYEKVNYPLAALEIKIQISNNLVTLESVRDLVQLNTPAINAAKLGTVLTAPRACSLSDLPGYVQTIEVYFQSFYHNTQSFFFKSSFKKLVGNKLPTISPRIGIQIVQKEDRKLLDYSELITTIESGSGKKFVDLITSYAEGNADLNTTYHEVQSSFESEYPPKSSKQFLNDVPLSLNANQKKILTAVKNPKNTIVRVDGPPGTGKSYTITALVYLANLLNKTVVITSHKPQALDVVEEKLSEQFKQVHPYAKPTILRLTKRDEKTLNSVENTLSDAVVSQTLSRSLSINTDLVSKDLEQLEWNFSKHLETNWEQGTKQYGQLEQLQQLGALSQQLGISLSSNQVPIGFTYKQVKEASHTAANLPFELSVEQLAFLKDNLEKRFSWQEAVQTVGGAGSTKTEESTSDFTLETLDEYHKLLKNLLSFANNKALLSDCWLPDDFSLPKINTTTALLSYKQLESVLEIVRQYRQAEKKITARVFGSEELRRIEHTLKLDYQDVWESIEAKGSERVLFDLERDLKILSDAQQQTSWLNLDYLIKQTPDLPTLTQLLQKLNQPNFKQINNFLSSQLQKPLSQCSLVELQQQIDQIIATSHQTEARKILLPLAQQFSLSVTNTDQLSSLISNLHQLDQVIDQEFVDSVTHTFDLFGNLLEKLSITPNDIRKLSALTDDSSQVQLTNEYIEKYLGLESASPIQMDVDSLEKHVEKNLRLLTQKNEARFARLAEHPNEVQRIMTAIDNNQRLTTDQAQVLLENVPCIIAPPDLISQFFPMDADMLDWLIIDEASQVSIAESLSLMLRAKQTVVFGDELQYGAVGATNVSKQYSEEFFRNILEDYSKDKGVEISEEEKARIADEVSNPVSDEAAAVSDPSIYHVDPNTKEWLKTFGIRTSTLDFAKAIRNYSDSLVTHFRSYPELIDYSNQVFYKPSEINLVTSRIRTKPINQVLEFIKVETKGLAGQNINLDEIEAVQRKLQQLHDRHFEGSIGIICSFREQTDRMREVLRKDLSCYAELVQFNNLKIWFVGDVQGEERDVIIYSFVEDKKIGNANLGTIYPVIGGVADDIRNLRMQRLNVGFSRAKDCMVFVHSMELSEYKNTRLGDALEFYWNTLQQTSDNYISDTAVFGSPAEERLYSLLTQTDLYKQFKQHIRLIAQFEIGKYIKEEFRRYIPNYRVDFLLTLTVGHKEHSLVIEYDGIEFHTQNPYAISSAAEFDQEYIEYDIQRQMELESYGYKFLRINKFTLLPKIDGQTEVDVLNQLLSQKLGKTIAELQNHLYAQPKPKPVTVLHDGSGEYQVNQRSPMETELEKLIRETSFYKQRETDIELLSNYSISQEFGEDYPKHMKQYQVDFLLKMKSTESQCKVVIEYDGVKFHTDQPEKVTSAQEFDQGLSEEDIQRQHDLEELGFQVVRVNKFTLFDTSDNLTPVERVNELLESAYQVCQDRSNNE